MQCACTGYYNTRRRKQDVMRGRCAGMGHSQGRRIRPNYDVHISERSNFENHKYLAVATCWSQKFLINNLCFLYINKLVRF